MAWVMVTEMPAILALPDLCAPVLLVATLKAAGPLPVLDAPRATEIQDVPLVAVQAQPARVITGTVNRKPPVCWDVDGEPREKVQA